mmetsp:Transcript_11268/g.33858  ORF Transcript_11268/g.33858 Transcript_11268/m.33858 type:complete len:215 (-) Transcript_11268:552-1196(-)
MHARDLGRPARKFLAGIRGPRLTLRASLRCARAWLSLSAPRLRSLFASPMTQGLPKCIPMRPASASRRSLRIVSGARISASTSSDLPSCSRCSSACMRGSCRIATTSGSRSALSAASRAERSSAVSTAAGRMAASRAAPSSPSALKCSPISLRKACGEGRARLDEPLESRRTCESWLVSVPAKSRFSPPRGRTAPSPPWGRSAAPPSPRRTARP